MIVPMQRVTLLCTAGGRDAALARLQDLGVLHVDVAASDAADLRTAQADVEHAGEALHLIVQASAQPDALAKCAACAEPCDEAARQDARGDVPLPAVTVGKILDLGRESEVLEAEIDAIDDEVSRYIGFGEFNPASIAALAAKGLAVTLFRAPLEAFPQAGDAGYVQMLSHEDHHALGVAIGDVALGEKAERFAPPSRSISAAQARRTAACVRHAQINRTLAELAKDAEVIRQEIGRLTEIRDFITAQTSMGNADGIVWLTGYCPSEQIPAIQTAAHGAGWALVARDPAPDENPPTLIRPPAIARPVNALFKMLGILPGYRETDISVVFYAFFTLFFAMLVGDAGYGVILLAATLLLRRKFRQAPSAPFTLMTIFSTATIIWGVLTATYFGIPIGSLPGVLRHPVAVWLGGQQNIMQFCFFLGALHLSVARLWNAAGLFPSKKFLAQIGWVGIVWTMYYAACMVSVDGFVFPRFMLGVAGGSTMMIALFMLDRSELKTNGVDLGMLPLNIISCLGDVISYVRLFAVGMASVKVAENFNQMAMDLSLPLWAKIPCVLLILLAGHGLNLMMGALSILVHAVRLNTLEFSNHKGVSWCGFAYRPFQRQTQAARVVAE